LRDPKSEITRVLFKYWGKCSYLLITKQKNTVIFRVVNLAQHSQSAAPAEGILISHKTYHHAQSRFNDYQQEPISVEVVWNWYLFILWGRLPRDCVPCNEINLTRFAGKIGGGKLRIKI